MPQLQYTEWRQTLRAAKEEMMRGSPPDDPFGDHEVRWRIGELIGRYAYAAYGYDAEVCRGRR
jgi:hypothetical protein